MKEQMKLRMTVMVDVSGCSRSSDRRLQSGRAFEEACMHGDASVIDGAVTLLCSLAERPRRRNPTTLAPDLARCPRQRDASPADKSVPASCTVDNPLVNYRRLMTAAVSLPAAGFNYWSRRAVCVRVFHVAGQPNPALTTSSLAPKTSLII